MTSRKQPGVAFWAIVVVVLVLAYLVSFGPACWVSSHLIAGMHIEIKVQHDPEIHPCLSVAL